LVLVLIFPISTLELNFNDICEGVGADSKLQERVLSFGGDSGCTSCSLNLVTPQLSSLAY